MAGSAGHPDQGLPGHSRAPGGAARQEPREAAARAPGDAGLQPSPEAAAQAAGDAGLQESREAAARASGGAWRAPRAAARMTAAALALLRAVTGEQRLVLNPGLDSFDLESLRRFWTYLPVLERPGLPLRVLSDQQRKLAHELVIASVSMEGYAQVVSVLAMEHVRRALIQASVPERAHMFDPERYCFRIFGTPGAPGNEPWGWQLAGHHVSLNFTVAGELVSGTPCMLGSVPASFGALSPLAHEEADGFRFVNSLRPGQRARAVIWHRPPPDFATRVVPRIGAVERPDHVFPPEPDYTINDEERSALAYVRSGPRGIGGADLDPAQRDALTDLVALFAGRLPGEVAEAELRRLDAAGTENLWFAWAGGTKRGDRHYFRVQGPGLLIEHDNTQGGGDHVHSVWRVPGGDFGDDLLAAHYREQPH